MITTKYENQTIACVMQESELTADACASGVISINPTDGSFRFVEAVRQQKSHARNLKLYDGTRLSFVRQANGLYQPHCRLIDATKVTNPEGLAFEIYMELVEAFKTMQ